MQMIFTINVNN